MFNVCVYVPFKVNYNVHCSNKLTTEKPGFPLTIYNIAEIVGKAFPQAFIPALYLPYIMKGFKRTGIWHFNSDLFTDADFLSASVTNRLIEDEDETNNIHDTSSPSTSNVAGLNFA